jgi:hypothetical protein
VEAVSEEADESRRSRAANPLAVFLATVLVVAVAVGIWWFGRSSPASPDGLADEPNGPPVIVEDDADALPTLEAGLVSQDASGDPVFSWINPAPELGDQYHWWLLSTPDDSHTLGQTQLALPRSEFGGGSVCIEVQLVREERASEQKLRICEQ